MNDLITINEIKTQVIRKFKFDMKTSSRNITKLRVALQNMNSAELLQIASSNGCLETSLKMRFIMSLKFQNSH